MDGNDGGGARAKVLGDHIHAHKGEPRNQDTAVQRDPVELYEGLVGQKVHAYHADGKQGYYRSRNGSEQYFGFEI